MRLFLVRRTRSFISDNYAETDLETGRKFLTFPDGSRSYFPVRIPKTARFAIDDHNPRDQYAQLYSDPVAETIGNLKLPRYGLANYISESPPKPPTSAEGKQLDDLSRGGKRLIGFCRIQPLQTAGKQRDRVYSIRGMPCFAKPCLPSMPSKTTNPCPSDPKTPRCSMPASTTKTPMRRTSFLIRLTKTMRSTDDPAQSPSLSTVYDFRAQAAEIYGRYTAEYRRRFKWIRPDLFTDALAEDLASDAHLLIDILQSYGAWDAAADEKLNALENLLVQTHPIEKVLVFTQFADTVRYLKAELSARGVSRIEEVTGDSPNPTALAWRFSPVSNNKQDRVASADELRVLISTDILE